MQALNLDEDPAFAAASEQVLAEAQTQAVERKAPATRRSVATSAKKVAATKAVPAAKKAAAKPRSTAATSTPPSRRRGPAMASSIDWDDKIANASSPEQVEYEEVRASVDGFVERWSPADSETRKRLAKAITSTDDAEMGKVLQYLPKAIHDVVVAAPAAPAVSPSSTSTPATNGSTPHPAVTRVGTPIQLNGEYGAYDTGDGFIHLHGPDDAYKRLTAEEWKDSSQNVEKELSGSGKKKPGKSGFTFFPRA